MPILASRPKTSSQFKKRPAEHIDSKKPYQNTWAKIQPNITKKFFIKHFTAAEPLSSGPGRIRRAKNLSKWYYVA